MSGQVLEPHFDRTCSIPVSQMTHNMLRKQFRGAFRDWNILFMNFYICRSTICKLFWNYTFVRFAVLLLNPLNVHCECDHHNRLSCPLIVVSVKEAFCFS